MKIITSLKKLGFKPRFVCNNIKPFYTSIIELFGEQRVIKVAPWKKFCAELKGTALLPSDLNIKAAPTLNKNFNKVPESVKVLMSANITNIFGQSNTEISTYVITYDPNLKDMSKIDFKLSKNNANYLLTARRFKIPIYNLANDNDVKDLNAIINPDQAIEF